MSLFILSGLGHQSGLTVIIIMVPRGQKDTIKAHAEKFDMGMNAYINMLVEKDMGDSLSD